MLLKSGFVRIDLRIVPGQLCHTALAKVSPDSVEMFPREWLSR
jgi:hypothetical protein